LHPYHHKREIYRISASSKKEINLTAQNTEHMSPSATTTTAPATNGNGAIKVKNGANGSANGTHANGNGVVKNGNGKHGKEAHLSSTELIRLENEHGAHK
jgi:hypothetical protein